MITINPKTKTHTQQEKKKGKKRNAKPQILSGLPIWMESIELLGHRGRLNNLRSFSLHLWVVFETCPLPFSSVMFHDHPCESPLSCRSHLFICTLHFCSCCKVCECTLSCPLRAEISLLLFLCWILFSPLSTPLPSPFLWVSWFYAKLISIIDAFVSCAFFFYAVSSPGLAITCSFSLRTILMCGGAHGLILWTIWAVFFTWMCLLTRNSKYKPSTQHYSAGLRMQYKY